MFVTNYYDIFSLRFTNIHESSYSKTQLVNSMVNAVSIDNFIQFKNERNSNERKYIDLFYSTIRFIQIYCRRSHSPLFSPQGFQAANISSKLKRTSQYPRLRLHFTSPDATTATGFELLKSKFNLRESVRAIGHQMWLVANGYVIGITSTSAS